VIRTEKGRASVPHVREISHAPNPTKKALPANMNSAKTFGGIGVGEPFPMKVWAGGTATLRLVAASRLSVARNRSLAKGCLPGSRATLLRGRSLERSRVTLRAPTPPASGVQSGFHPACLRQWGGPFVRPSLDYRARLTHSGRLQFDRWRARTLIGIPADVTVGLGVPLGLEPRPPKAPRRVTGDAGCSTDGSVEKLYIL
jgi:hypothetical protein